MVLLIALVIRDTRIEKITLLLFSIFDQQKIFFFLDYLQRESPFSVQAVLLIRGKNNSYGPQTVRE